ncbi:MAG TPA: glycoside hydrolase family 30 beta sandwich domain-containing protein [Planctomycetota bacterium]|nr:glycoside hydrolase family 30 beta sandwich domain-containing protein [Planctomycetota bacterium]
MTRSWSCLVLVIAAGCFGRSEEVARTGVVTVQVDWESIRQTMVGFGGTMGWIHPHPRQREKIFDLLFTELGASVLRIQALGGEAGDEDCLEPANDNDDPDTFNWAGFAIRTTEAKNAIIIKAARDRGVKTIIATPWSPPGWMKTNGTRAGGGNLREDCIAEYAELWAAYVIGMRREFGVDIHHISLQNEPDLTYYYPTCRWEPEFLARTAEAVRARLQREGLDVQVLGPDTCRIYNMPEYVEVEEETISQSGDLRPRRAAPILTHLYDLSVPYERVDRDASRWRDARTFAQNMGRPLWLMETANYLSYGIEPASWDEAMIWAQKIHWALAEGDCEVVCWWSLFFDKKGEALVYCPESENEQYEITPKFYTSMNWFRFVRPGMVRCEAKTDEEGLLVTAFSGADGERVIVVVNTGGTAREVQLAPPAGGWRRYETSASRHCESLAPVTGPRLALPAGSVTTLVGGRRE